ncbi:MAG TPA: penicillin-binding transpeptidase domain-containing protein [Polyangiaceae bacterium]|nr:penicillin-binding transpeptidase domain-containing protein [Polyangiaceae bacterium]
MTLVSMLGIVLRASLLLALSLAALPALRGASAALRRWLVLAGLCASLAVPVLALSLPSRQLVYVPAPAFVGHVVAETLSANVASAPVRANQSPMLHTPSSRLSASAWLLSIWALGALFVGARTLTGRLWARRLRATARPTADGVSVSSHVEAPVVIGVFRPIVVLPVASESWTEERKRVVLLHEFSHVRRYDGLALSIAELACTLYWFQPLTWFARNRLRRECELAADEAVIAAGLRASSYAQHLLEIARGLVPAGGIAMAARPSELARRIEALVSRERLPAPFTRAHAALLSALAFSALAGVACVGSETKPAQTPNSARANSRVKAIDARLQTIAEEEARRVHAEWGAERVAILVLDPHTGTLLANYDDRPDKPMLAASTLKPFSIAMALDAELITPEQRFDCGNGTRNYGPLVLRDAGQYGSLDVREILAVSSNIGISRIFDVLGGERLGDGLRRFHLGAPAEIPSGTIKGAVIALGEGSTTTPAALVSAYGVFANDGLYASPGGAQPERVIKASTAKTVRDMLDGAVNGERATGKAAAVPGARVGGKTGTSDDSDCETCPQGQGTFVHFVGIVPIDSPRWVIYVGVGKPEKAGTGGTIAAPVFSRVATRALGL